MFFERLLDNQRGAAMNKTVHPSMEELERWRAISLAASEKAAAAYPAVYRDIKNIALRVACGPLDIGDYCRIARQLSGLLAKLAETEALSLFGHFSRSIDPFQSGSAMYFRAECLDLLEQMKFVDRMVAAKRRLHLVR